MGIVAIKSHMNKKTHNKLESEQQESNNFFKKIKNTVEPNNKDVRLDTPDEVVVEVSTFSSTETQSTIPYSLLDDSKLTAEIWSNY